VQILRDQDQRSLGTKPVGQVQHAFGGRDHGIHHGRRVIAVEELCNLDNCRVPGLNADS
jgi:hypothetical protein